MKPISLYEFGSDERVVRQIQSRFVKFFRNSAPVLDIGCGRGLFLELLGAEGIEAVGIDHSQESVAACRERGFTVTREDARQYLDRAAGRFGGIFCSHVIEHMGYDDAMNFLALCHHALREGGVLLLVTPNPEDLTIIGEIFWLDPTHVRPYPKLLLQSMLQANGFEVRLAQQFLGSWRMIGRRNLPMYLLRRMLLGRHFGRPNTLVLAEKQTPPESIAETEKIHCQNRA
jgi:2-polyprenyl-3-methyl-5-hydroxy-6-metoxy-1,4-benzoquinol methylase